MIGTTIGHYKIESKLGEGGMGVVYKATDTTLERAVALKFLPEYAASKPADLERFVQEAKAAAALNHPNICTIFGIEKSDDKHFIVMEFVDGQMLSEKIASLTMKQSLDIGIQIAEGLAAAHEKGIVHRDIKPENIMVRKDGIIQIMDFGLAKLRGASRLTKEGSTVGTAGYMSPEQVQGQETDHRSDIFSLGVLLYEMLTGQAPFKGMHETAIAYEIVNVDTPPMSTIKPEITPELDAIILECLDKDPNERTQAAKQVANDLKRFRRTSSRSRVSRVSAALPSMSSPQMSAQAAPVTFGLSKLRAYAPWTTAGTAILALAAVLLFSVGKDTPLPTIQALIPAPEGTNFFSYGSAAGPPVISPDGTMIVFSAMTPNGSTSLYLRKLSEPEATRIAGTEFAMYPFWSFDSRSIGFSTGTSLKKVDIIGNPPTTIASWFNLLGSSWSSRDVIISSSPRGPLMMVQASGGTPVQLTQIDTLKNEVSHRWPFFLPDGKHFLYFSRKLSYATAAEGDAIMVGSLDGDPPVFVVQSSSQAVYASGYLLFMRGSTLLAQKFDPESFTVSGEAVPVREKVINDVGFNLAVMSVSQNNILTFQTGFGVSGARMAIVDRKGNIQRYVGEIAEHYQPRIAPDQRRIAVNIFEPRSRTQNLWTIDLGRNTATRLTSGETIDFWPVWSPDGTRLAYTAIRPGVFKVYLRSLFGRESDQLLYESSRGAYLTDWSPDGSALVFVESRERSLGDILILDPEKGETPTLYFSSQFNENDPNFSPDGRWLTYSSNETGRDEIYVRPWPGPGNAIKISEAGGIVPHWSHSGKEIFYIASENAFMSAAVRATASSVEVMSNSKLFDRPQIMNTEYDVFKDDQRFLMNRIVEPAETDPLTVVVNWTKTVEKK